MLAWPAWWRRLSGRAPLTTKRAATSQGTRLTAVDHVSVCYRCSTRQTTAVLNYHSLVCAAKGQIRDHFNVTLYDTHEFTNHAGVLTKYISLDICQHESIRSWLDRVCISRHCQQMLLNIFQTDPKFDGRFLPTHEHVR